MDHDTGPNRGHAPPHRGDRRLGTDYDHRFSTDERDFAELGGASRDLDGVTL